MANAVPELLTSTANDQTAPPPVMLPYQQRWIADQSPLKVIEKSRRTGITWAEAADSVLSAAADRQAKGQNVYYLGYNQDMTMEFIDACAMWARAFNQAAGAVEEGIWEDGDKHIKTYVIRFPKSGFRITALTSRPSNLRGRQGVVILDEAAFHESLDELLKAALALLIWGGKVRVISTHNGDDNPFNELIQEIRAGKRDGSVQRITFKEAVDEGLYQRVCLRRGIPYVKKEEQQWSDGIYRFYGDAAEEELDAIPSKSGGKWLTQALLERLQDKTIPVLRFTAPQGFENWTEDARNAEVEDWFNEHLLPILEGLPRNVNSFYGLDFARKKNACSFWPLLEQQDTRKKCPFVFEMFNVPYKQQEKLLLLIVKRLPSFRKGAHDATGNGGYLAEAMQVVYGQRIEAVHLTENWYRDNTPPFKAALEDGDLAGIPADKDIKDDHSAFKLVKGVARIPSMGESNQHDKKRHGDSAIAHLLAKYASMNPDAPIEFIALPDRDQHARGHDVYDDWLSEKGCF